MQYTIYVSICIPTYNHKKWLTTCLNSVFSQKSNFNVEILVGLEYDDIDSEKYIPSFEEKSNFKLNIVRNTKEGLIYINDNRSGRGNTLNLLRNARGKYIAICEGDDYWTDPLKLQKQVDFLEVNAEYVGCYHGCKHINEKDEVIKSSRYETYHDQPADKMLTAQGAMITHTVMFRNIIKEYPAIFEKAPSGDTILYHLLGFHGSGKFISDIQYSAYRIHSGGIWSGINNLQRMQNNFNTLTAIKKNLIANFGKNSKYVSEITGSVSMNINGYLFQSLISKNFTEYLQMIRLILTQENFSKPLLLKRHVVYILKKFLKIKS